MNPLATDPAFRLPVSWQDHDRDLTSRLIPLLIKNIAVPAGVGLFFHTMFNVADTFFAGRVSTQALAALSLSFPPFS